MSVGTGLSITREHISFKKSCILGGVCGISAGVSALIFWYLIFAVFQHSFSTFFYAFVRQKITFLCRAAFMGVWNRSFFCLCTSFYHRSIVFLCTTRSVTVWVSYFTFCWRWWSRMLLVANIWDDGLYYWEPDVAYCWIFPLFFTIPSIFLISFTV